MKFALQNSVAYCVKEEKACISWAETYFKDCLCNTSDELSFGFGLISLLCWGVAEIPQIITNFKNKSGHGISLVFLLTWILGLHFLLSLINLSLHRSWISLHTHKHKHVCCLTFLLRCLNLNLQRHIQFSWLYSRTCDGES